MTWPGYHKWLMTSWMLVWFTLPLWNVGNSLSIALLAVVVIVGLINRPVALSGHGLVVLLLFALFFVVHLTSDLLYSGERTPGYMVVRKSAFLVIPATLLLIPAEVGELRRGAYRALAISVLLAGIVMLVESLYRFVLSGDVSVFVYHGLATPWEAGAVYLSLFLSVLLIVIVKQPEMVFPGRANAVLFAFFFLLLLLCASKLFVIITVPIVLYYLIKKYKKILFKRPAVSVALIAVALLSFLPFIQRMSIFADPELHLVTQEHYDPSTELNGVNLRLIQSRFGIEILNKYNAWLTGTGIERKTLLDEKYVNAGLYTGSDALGDTGYLGYNFHNQWMETLVGNGVLGLLLLMSIIFARLVRKNDTRLFPPEVYFLLLAFFFTESLLERQVGLVFVCLLFSNLEQK